MYISGFFGGSDIYLQCRRPRFNPWVGKISWRRKWQSTPVFFAWEFPETVKPGKLQSTGMQRVGYIHKVHISLYANPNFPIQSALPFQRIVWFFFNSLNPVHSGTTSTGNSGSWWPLQASIHFPNQNASTGIIFHVCHSRVGFFTYIFLIKAEGLIPLPCFSLNWIKIKIYLPLL